MSSNTRETVNIVEKFEEKAKGAKKIKSEAKKRLKHAQERLEEIQMRQASEVSLLQNDIVKAEKLLADMAGEEAFDQPKQQKRIAELRAKAESLACSHRSSSELLEAIRNVSEAEAESEAAERACGECDARLGVALGLKESHGHDPAYGVLVAPAYATLQEAIDDYISHLSYWVDVVADKIDSVVFSPVYRGDQTVSLPIAASAGATYVRNVVPRELAWLCEFGVSPYNEMRQPSLDGFVSNGVTFAAKNGMRRFPKDAGSSTVLPETIYASKATNCRGLCYIVSDDKFYGLSAEKFRVLKVTPEKKEYYGHVVQHARREEQVCDASSIICDMHPAILEAIEGMRGEFANLSAAKSDRAVKIRGAVEAVAVTAPFFEHGQGRMGNDEISNLVGAYWSAFVNAPWEGSVTGEVAMIKHLCERKIETPHVWSNSVKGHYGLRVRTRDHDWIEASIYCPPEALSPKQTIPQHEVRYIVGGERTCASLVRVGPCFIKVHPRRR